MAEESYFHVKTTNKQRPQPFSGHSDPGFRQISVQSLAIDEFEEWKSFTISLRGCFGIKIGLWNSLAQMI